MSKNLRMSEAEYHELLNRNTRTLVDKIQTSPVKILKDPEPMDNTEHWEQAKLVWWLKEQGIRHNATPNGGGRTKRQAQELKEEGVVPGFPDLTIWPPLDRPELPVLFIEMKRVKGGEVSEDQQKWMDYFEELEPNYKIRSRVCYGYLDAKAFILAYGY